MPPSSLSTPRRAPYASAAEEFVDELSDSSSSSMAAAGRAGPSALRQMSALGEFRQPGGGGRRRPEPVVVTAARPASGSHSPLAAGAGRRSSKLQPSAFVMQGAAEEIVSTSDVRRVSGSSPRGNRVAVPSSSAAGRGLAEDGVEVEAGVSPAASAVPPTPAARRKHSSPMLASTPVHTSAKFRSVADHIAFAFSCQGNH